MALNIYKEIKESYKFPIPNGRYQCTYPSCNKIFRHARYINQHIQRHIGYKCNVCKKIFKFKRDRTTHIKNEHHNKSKFHNLPGTQTDLQWNSLNCFDNLPDWLIPDNQPTDLVTDVSKYSLEETYEIPRIFSNLVDEEKSHPYGFSMV